MPQSLLKFARNLLRPGEFRMDALFHDFEGCWSDAKAVTDGYGTTEILERVLAASLAVAEGRSVHERDSVTFDRIEYAWPVLASLMWSAARNDGSLRVLDLGGALGSSYRQNRRFLCDLVDVSWAVVEQAAFADAGRIHFEDDVLSFHATIPSAASTGPQIALASSSLQYLDDPTQALKELSRTEISTLVIDRTPVHTGPQDKITLQRVPTHIYPATYPARIFSRQRLETTLEELGWLILEEFATLERPSRTDSGFAFSWTGIVCTRREIDADAF